MKALVELEKYQARTLIKRFELSDNPTEEELGQALMSMLSEYDEIMDALGEEYDSTIDD